MLTIDQVAEVAHEANRAYCKGLGDHSQPAWDDAPEWQKQSARTGVNFIAANPEAAPGDSHRSWLDEKTRDGWKYGPVKDPEKKEHPCFVPFEQLPLDQQIKDVLFVNVVAALRLVIDRR
jgi:hypothetical protein